MAVASRTNKAAWAHALLKAFPLPGCADRTIADLLVQSEIYPGDKTRHFAALREGTGVVTSEGI